MGRTVHKETYERPHCGGKSTAAEFSAKCILKEKAARATLAIPTLAPFPATIYLFKGRLHATASLCREFLSPLRGRSSWGTCCTSGTTWKRPGTTSETGCEPMNSGGTPCR